MRKHSRSKARGLRQFTRVMRAKRWTFLQWAIRMQEEAFMYGDVGKDPETFSGLNTLRKQLNEPNPLMAELESQI